MQRPEGPYHQSEINDYLTCPQVLLLKMEGVEPLFRPLGLVRGGAVHRAIHRLHAEGAWDRWRAVFDEVWDDAFSRPGPPVDGPPEKVEDEYRTWQTAIGHYVDQQRQAAVLYTELGVRGVVTSRSGREYVVEGTVDQIRASADGRGYEIYELKTNTSLPGRASLERNVQLCLYAWCCVTGEVRVDGDWVPAREVLPGFLRACVFYKLSSLIPYRRAGRRSDGTRYEKGDLRGDPCVPVPMDPDRLVEGTRAIARIIAAMRAGGFFWNPSSLYGGCDTCPYKYACGTSFSSNREPVAAVPGMIA